MFTETFSSALFLAISVFCFVFKGNALLAFVVSVLYLLHFPPKPTI